MIGKDVDVAVFHEHFTILVVGHHSINRKPFGNVSGFCDLPATIAEHRAAGAAGDVPKNEISGWS
jgi:hypothetical protein